MSFCFLCEEKITAKNVSEEHIIPNGLHGRLKSSDLLCSECNSKLGEDIDAEFCEIFSCFTSPLNKKLASKDRGNNPSKAEGRVLLESGKELKVTFQENKIIPSKTCYEVINRDEVHIYFPKKSEGYKNHVKRILLEKNQINEGADIKCFAEIENPEQAGLFFSEGKPLFNSIFRKGLNKIAVDFAVHNEIDSNELPNALNKEEQKILSADNIFPFVPLGAFDFVIELSRFKIEYGYPSHTLILFTENFTDRQVLFCYIDLFSTFQYYVVLNDDYKGEEINNIYYQTLRKQTIPEIEIRGSSPKDLMIIANDLGVDHRNFGGKSYEEIYRRLENAQKQRKPNYTQGIASFLQSATQALFPIILLMKGNKTEQLGDHYQNIINVIPKLENEDFLSILQEFRRIDSEEISTFYKQNYIEYKEDKSFEFYSYPDKIKELESDDFSMFQQYGFLKFTQLSIFANSNSE
ncbi:HNH endonuclease [Fodinibius halophilus]|uniref:HNH endonuclease n=1 Tax=Fodinibius halophilus TaxID=1736908 RepID=A0A6M1T2G7_9BACT|nr:HNH endonuclease [Fodinibius halophilus]NGP90278.1 HNH endonuclease [Fodinibius halophilus]